MIGPVENIGDLAARTGVSRRMLRHWQAAGLPQPASVDPWTQRRGYDPAQAGRVRAIAALRDLGFGLEVIKDLLDSDLTQGRLITLLEQHRETLATQIAADSTALAQIDRRLRSLTEGRHTMMHALTLGTLPAIDLNGYLETVRDETEISGAVGRLCRTLQVDPAKPSSDLVLIYDPTTSDEVIIVAAALDRSGGHDPATRSVHGPAVEHGATLRLPTAPTSVADIWVGFDAELARRGLRSHGPYRQICHPDGSVTFAAPTAPVA